MKRSVAGHLAGGSAGAMAGAGQLAARVGLHDWLVEAPPAASLRADGLGRWQAARLAGQLHRRLLDGRVVVYPDPRGAPREVDDPSHVHGRVIQLAQSLAEQISRANAELALAGTGASRERVLTGLRECASWSAGRLDQERARFAAAYPEPVEILPPDRYRDLVLLPATGCPNASCTFCAFYRGNSFQPLSAVELRHHVEAVRDFFGPALALRTGLFLGSASALSLSQRRLRSLLQLSRELLGPMRRGAAAFWDPDHSPDRAPAEWAELVDLSLRAVYVGLETGLGELRQRVGKSADVESVVAAVTRARDAVPAEGLRLGLIVMVGLGGAASVVAHREATAELVRRLPLRRSDVVYLSPLAGSLPPDELSAQASQLKRALRAATEAQVVPYAMEQFRYYA